MKRIKYLLLGAILPLLFIGCGFENEPISILGDLQFASYGVNRLRTISVYPEDETEIKITRSQGLSKDVEFEVVIDKSLIDKYNEENEADMLEVPSEFYTLSDSKVLFEKNTKELTIKVNFKPADLIKKEGRERAGKMMIPIKLVPLSDGMGPVENNLTYLIQLVIENPQINVVVTAYEHALTFISKIENVRTIEVEATSNFKTVDLSKLQLEYKQEDVDAYNTKNGTEYKLLPESSIKHIAPTFDGTNKIAYDIDLSCGNLPVEDIYLLPISMKSRDTEYVINQDNPVYVVVTVAELVQSITDPVKDLWTNKSSKVEIPIKTNINGAISEEQVIKFSYDKAKIDEYNKEYGTQYKALDDKLIVSIPEAEIEIGKMSVESILTLDLTNLAYEAYYKAAEGSNPAIGTPPTEYLIPLVLDKSVLLEGTKVVDEVVYIKLRKTIYGLYDISGDTNWMKEEVKYTKSDKKPEEFPFMNTYYSWDHGYQWKIVWDANYNNENNKKKIEIFSTVTSGYTLEQQIAQTYDNESYFDMTTGEIFLVFKYYYNEDDKKKDNPQKINAKLVSLRKP